MRLTATQIEDNTWAEETEKLEDSPSQDRQGEQPNKKSVAITTEASNSIPRCLYPRKLKIHKNLHRNYNGQNY